MTNVKKAGKKLVKALSEALQEDGKAVREGKEQLIKDTAKVGDALREEARLKKHSK